MKRKKIIFVLFFAFTFLSNSISINAEDWINIKNLSGTWKFSIGDKSEWINPKFNDSNWEKIEVPSSWENQGFHGYDGYAWYRINFKIDSEFKGNSLELRLGYVDDVDEVYLNGNLIGFSGSFPPNYSTAYYAKRKYPIPNSFLNFGGENVISIRIYDKELEGGIMSGEIGIFAKLSGLIPDFNLSGMWHFKTGDNLEWKEPDFSFQSWDKIVVPGIWETYGFRDYDGFAWYIREFEIPNKLNDENLVLLLGKIDDIDEVFINGKLVGSTGKMDSNPENIQARNEYSQLRGYYLSQDAINKNGKNIIAVRVFDIYKEGGIYSGPIGLITQKNYSDYWKNKRTKKKSIFDWIFE